MTHEPDMSMSSLTGKRILSLIRDGDFAHPGEADAVGLVLDGLPRDRSRRVLDLGCGLGGTAALIADRGYGHVSGIDVDPDTIAYACHAHPEPSFSCASASEISTVVNGTFDAIVMFTSFYCFPDQDQVLRECLALAHAGSEMRIFDYSTPSWNRQAREFCARYARGHWRPLVQDEVDERFERNGWSITSRRDLTNEFRMWYQGLLSKIVARRERIVQASDENWYRYAYRRYDDLLVAIEEGTIGGALIRAVPAPAPASRR
jgi:phosphoethanolamine N-methyltransferase